MPGEPTGDPVAPVRWTVFLRVVRERVRPHWRLFAVSAVCMVVTALATAAFARLLGPGITKVFERGDVWRAPLAFALVMGVKAVTEYWHARAMNTLGQTLIADLQGDLFAKLVRADLKRLQATHSGAFLSNFLNDAVLLRDAFSTGATAALQHALTLAGLLVVMAMTDPVLTGFIVLAAPLAAVGLRRAGRRMRVSVSAGMEAASDLSTAVLETLDGVRVVKAARREDAEIDRVRGLAQARADYVARGLNARAQSGPLSEAWVGLGVAAAFAYAGWRSASGALPLADFITWIGAAVLAFRPINALATANVVIGEGLLAAARLLGALDVPAEVADRPGARTLGRAQGRLAFEGVAFRYSPERAALDGVDLSVEPGECVAIVWASGSGKSTILNLALRFYDVDGGAVRLDGHDVRDLTLESLRANIALVTQDPFLFDDTLRANIAYARPDATDTEIAAAAEAAAVHDVIIGLPGGYDARAGEAGARLSGGQRQRIALARAILADAPILLLDEATAALDAESETKVLDAVGRARAGRTTIMVAHRLSTIVDADRIYVLDAGRVVETGDHTALMARNGVYARLNAAQAQAGFSQSAGA
ncbi:MAG: ABC transporter ATP-binding protein [Maricaulaceae bacterium]